MMAVQSADQELWTWTCKCPELGEVSTYSEDSVLCSAVDVARLDVVVALGASGCEEKGSDMSTKSLGTARVKALVRRRAARSGFMASLLYPRARTSGP
jgi:hypothetical protein